jgi:hypothetical protein
MSFNQNAGIAGLETYSVAVPTAGLYFVDGKISLPTLSQGGGQSQVVATVVNQTGPVTIYTGIAGAEGLKCNASCAAGDVLAITLSSGAAVDQVPNAVKCVLAIGSGN